MESSFASGDPAGSYTHCGIYQRVPAVYAGGFYVEEDDRTRGMRVQWDGSVAEGSRVAVAGVVTTIDGERRVVATSVVGM